MQQLQPQRQQRYDSAQGSAFTSADFVRG